MGQPGLHIVNITQMDLDIRKMMMKRLGSLHKTLHIGLDGIHLLLKRRQMLNDVINLRPGQVIRLIDLIAETIDLGLQRLQMRGNIRRLGQQLMDIFGQQRMNVL
jgi:hypothetical protein